MILSMKHDTRQKLKAAAGISLAAVLLLAAGFFAGRAAGSWLIKSVLLRESRLPLLLSRPVYQFYDIHTLLNSSDPYSRLSGYYSLVDANMIDEKFIRERYAREQEPVIRRTLLWVMGRSGDRRAALRCYAALYESSDDVMKKEIRALMERLDPAFYREFIKKSPVPGSGRPGK